MRCVGLLAVLLWSAQAWACVKDTECKGDRICVVPEGHSTGACRAPEQREPNVESASAKSAQSSTVSDIPESGRTLHFNVLGTLQFGLAHTWEWGQDTTVLLRTRLMNLGALPYIIAEGDGEEFTAGLGLSVQWRKYLGLGTQNGSFMGAGIEGMYTQTEDEDDVYETAYLVPQFGAGSRWYDGTSFSGVAAFVGFAIPVHTGGYVDGESYITGGLSWDIGWTL